MAEYDRGSVNRTGLLVAQGPAHITFHLEAIENLPARI